MSDAHATSQNISLSRVGRIVIVVTAFLGWFFGGMHMAITSLAMGSAANDFIRQTEDGALNADDKAAAEETMAEFDADNDRQLSEQEAARSEKQAPKPKTGQSISLEALAEFKRLSRNEPRSSSWFGYYVCAFLFGAALGGLVFGMIGDRYGRVIGMGASICTYSAVSLAAYYTQSLEQLWVARFLVCMGVGGMWPNGVALMSEAWEGVSRPVLAGVIGTSANMGIFPLWRM